MSILGKIMNKILGRDAKAPAPAPAPTAGMAPRSAPAAPAPVTPAPAPAAMSSVDVEAMLENLAANNPQKLNWRHSIVDLMKLVGMESSLAERKELAQELGYTGDMSDSASMNIWLHKEVLRKVAEHGGRVPASMLD